jgi:hypothetical protein
MRVGPWTIFAAVVTVAPGAAAEPSDPAPPHPEPRVIVDVLRVKGPHARADVEREARRALWGGIVECYRPAVRHQPKLRGEAEIELRVGANGKVTGVRARQRTLPDRDVVDCWVRQVARSPLGTARAASRVTLRIHVAPGDPERTSAGVDEG